MGSNVWNVTGSNFRSLKQCDYLNNMSPTVESSTRHYQFPVLLQTLITIEDVVYPASIAFQWDLPSLLTAGWTLVLTGRKHQVLLPTFFVFHHSDRDAQCRERISRERCKCGEKNSQTSVHSMLPQCKYRSHKAPFTVAWTHRRSFWARNRVIFESR